MTDIEQKALALVREVLAERNLSDKRAVRREVSPYTEALCRAIEQHEAFRQEVSDAVAEYKADQPHIWDHSARCFAQFIIHEPKPDPLVDAAKMMGYFNTAANAWAEDVRAALDELGLEIREKNDD